MTTEWEDILIAKGIMAPKHVQKAPTATEYDAMALENKEAVEALLDAELESRDLEDLEAELDDDDVLEAYRYVHVKPCPLVCLFCCVQEKASRRNASAGSKGQVRLPQGDWRARVQARGHTSTR